MFYFYVLQSEQNNDWFYKGSTADLRKRLKEHNSGQVESSKPYKPFRLVYYEAYLTEEGARKREASIKKSGSVWAPLRKRIAKTLEKKNK